MFFVLLRARARCMLHKKKKRFSAERIEYLPFKMADCALDDLYSVVHKLGAGGFSDVYKARYRAAKRTGALDASVECALKVDGGGEEQTVRRGLVHYESRVLRALQHIPCVPKLYHVGTFRMPLSGGNNRGSDSKNNGNCSSNDNNNGNDISEGKGEFGGNGDVKNDEMRAAIAMQLLGDDLEHVVCAPEQYLPPHDAATVGVALLNTIEQVHRAGYLHRDVKPSNIIVGRDGDHCIYLADFGLAKKWRDRSNAHIPYRVKNGVTGTMRYCSSFTHEMHESSRRDDVESLMWVILALSGPLPWQTSARSPKFQQITSKEQQALLLREKRRPSTTLTPSTELQQAINHVRSLGFESTPDYNFLRRCLQQCARARP